jgi:hypothetical protein
MVYKLVAGRTLKWTSTAVAMQQVDKQTAVSKQRFGKYVPAETISVLSIAMAL